MLQERIQASHNVCILGSSVDRNAAYRPVKADLNSSAVKSACGPVAHFNNHAQVHIHQNMSRSVSCSMHNVRGAAVQAMQRGAAVAYPPNTTSLSPHSVVLWPHLLRALASRPCAPQPCCNIYGRSLSGLNQIYDQSGFSGSVNKSSCESVYSRQRHRQSVWRG